MLHQLKYIDVLWIKNKILDIYIDRLINPINEYKNITCNLIIE